jgi:hypothetical protein
MTEISDPVGMVFDNYIAWKGTPDDMARPARPAEYLSPDFRVLEYAETGRHVFCTTGASYKVIPHSIARFHDPRGVRYEYLMHAAPELRREILNILLMAASYPFLQDFMYYAGCIIPFGGAIVTGSSMEYLYFTYPYEDDPRIFDPPPWGQIERDNLLIQTLWVFPIHRSEARYIETVGADEFEQLCESQQFQSHDFFRQPLV